MTLLTTVVFFGIALFIVLKAVDYAIRFSTRLARIFGVSPFMISFFVVAVVSCLPETSIGIMANLAGQPEVAFMALIGSNVLDLTFVFGTVAVFSRGIKVKSTVVRKDALYLLLMLLPLLLGVDGVITRFEGAVLIVGGLSFFYTIAKQRALFTKEIKREHYGHIVRTSFMLVISLIVMLVGANLTIGFLSSFASDLGIPAFLIALLVVGTGVCLPELLFTIEAVRKNRSDLALGDILGTVIIDSTIALGLVALILPLRLDAILFQVTAFFSVLAGCVIIYFLRVNKQLSSHEGYVLLLFYMAFIIVEFFIQYA